MIKTLDDLIGCEEYSSYSSETVYSIQDHCINGSHYETDVDTMVEHNEDGMFGVTHGDVIQNWRDFINGLNLSDKVLTTINQEINDCEEYHIKNNTYDEII